MTLTIFLTITPPLLILAFIILSDKFPEPLEMILSTFFIGFLLCLPAGILNNYLIFSREIPGDYVYLAGLTEETLKFMALFFFIRKRVEFNEPMDAIVYGVIVSLGFATFENISYVYQGNFEIDSFSLAIMRAVSAIPLHATCGIIMGYFFGLYAFTHSKQFLIKSIIFPMGIHATYNFLTSYDFFFLYFLVAVMVYARGLHTEFSELQLKKARENETKVI